MSHEIKNPNDLDFKDVVCYQCKKENPENVICITVNQLGNQVAEEETDLTTTCLG